MKIDNSTWLFLIILGLGWWAVTEYESNSLLKVDNSNKSKIIASQSLQFNRFNQIATSAYRYGIQAEVKSQERVIEYRTILKKEPTCDLLVPQSIADRLLKYTYESRSMYAVMVNKFCRRSKRHFLVHDIFDVALNNQSLNGVDNNCKTECNFQLHR